MEPLPAGREASSSVGAPPYVRHRPERSLLYQLVEEYYPAFNAHLAAQGPTLPTYVEQEFEDYLACGRLEHGFLRVRCGSCHTEHLVAFSCKRRGFCPSCGNLDAGAEIEELMRALSLRPYSCEAHCVRPSALRASVASFGSIISAPTAKRKKRPAPRALSDRQEFKASHLTSLLGLVAASVS